MLAEEFRKAPFLRLLFPLVGGICLGREWGPPPLLQLCLPVLAGILLFLPSGRRRPHRLRGAGGGLVLAAFFLAGIDLGNGTGNAPAAIRESVPEGLFLARVCRETEPSDRGLRITVDRIRRIEGERTTRLRGKASLFLACESSGNNHGPDPDMGPGSLVLVRCSLRPYTAPLNPGQFDYGAYLRGRGICLQAYAGPDSWLKAGEAAGGGPRIRSLRLRRRLMERLDERIPGRAERDILRALLLGYRERLDPAVEQNFIRSGTLHILAVSGLHVGIVYLLPASLLKILRRRRWTAAGGLLGTCGLLWGYALLTGFSTSVVRAVCMCCIHAAAMVCGRKTSPFQVVSLAAFLMIAARPAVVFEAGFRLSFAAVAGILLMYRRFRAMLRFPGMPGRWLSRMLSLSFSAQLATLPLSVFYFHQASPLAFLANLVVVPLAGLVLYLGLPFLLCSGWGPVSGSLAFLLGRTGTLLDRVTGAAAALPGSWIGGLTLSPLQVILLYLSGLLLLYFLGTRTARATFLWLASLLLLLLVTSARELSIRRQRKICVFALRHETAILFVEGRDAALFRGFGRAAGDSTRADKGESTRENSGEDLPYGIEGYCRRHGLRTPLRFSALDTISGGYAAQGSQRRNPARVSSGAGPPGLFSLPVRSPGIDAVCVEFPGMRLLILGRWDTDGSPGPSFPKADLLVLCNNPAIDPSLIPRFLRVPLVVADGSSRPRYAESTGRACLEQGLGFHYTGDAGYFERNLRNRQKK